MLKGTYFHFTEERIFSQTELPKMECIREVYFFSCVIKQNLNDHKSMASVWFFPSFALLQHHHPPFYSSYIFSLHSNFIKVYLSSSFCSKISRANTTLSSSCQYLEPNTKLYNLITSALLRMNSVGPWFQICSTPAFFFQEFSNKYTCLFPCLIMKIQNVEMKYFWWLINIPVINYPC